MQHLSLIDGSGFMFRARYAFPPMKNHHGQNINVVYGFMRMMLKLLMEHHDHFLIARDAPVQTQRHLKYSDYKANRKKIDDEFKQQIPILQNLVKELQIPNTIAPGYEADDIIATLVERFKIDPNISIQVFSSDKDLKQLLAHNVIITDPLKNNTTKTTDFEREFGFPPSSIVDYLALIGDSADNIKGVAGIGPKKALYLIQNYYSIENIYQNLEKISNDLRIKLEQGKEDAYFCKSLIALLQVPELQSSSLSNYKLNIDRAKRETILIQEWKFTGLQKTFDELKKHLTQPQQLGLF